jgi:hypothetical protein
MGLFGGMGVGVFESSFRAYPVSFIDRVRALRGSTREAATPHARCAPRAA